METEEKDLNIETKENRDQFYSLYGMLKKVKNNFKHEELTQKLSPSDFETFKVVRNDITA